MERLQVTPVDETIAYHHTCSSVKMGLEAKAVTLARACAAEVVVPEHVGCCGFAGDRGFNYPELNASALQHLRAGARGQMHRGLFHQPHVRDRLVGPQRDPLQVDSLSCRSMYPAQSDFLNGISSSPPALTAATGSALSPLAPRLAHLGPGRTLLCHRLLSPPGAGGDDPGTDARFQHQRSGPGPPLRVLLLQLLADADPHRDPCGQLGPAAVAHLRRVRLGGRRDPLRALAEHGVGLLRPPAHRGLCSGGVCGDP